MAGNPRDNVRRPRVKVERLDVVNMICGGVTPNQRDVELGMARVGPSGIEWRRDLLLTNSFRFLLNFYKKRRTPPWNELVTTKRWI